MLSRLASRKFLNGPPVDGSPVTGGWSTKSDAVSSKLPYNSALVWLLWIACVLWVAIRLPEDAIPTGDSGAYLTLASYRPPVYGWVLRGYQSLTGGLRYLPFFQLLLFASGLLVFALQLGRLLKTRLAAPAAVLLISMHVGIHEAPSWLMSESVFEFLILTGLGVQFCSIRTERAIPGALAAACFALAAGTRTAGAAFLIIPLLVTWLDRRRSLVVAAIRTGQIGLVTAAVLAVVMTGNWLKNDRFEIGTWTGISLLGKGLLLLEPSDVASLPPPVATVAPVADELRNLIEEQPDLAARLRAQDQAYQDLRFPLFYPLAEQSWPAWAEGDWQVRGELALNLNRILIARHPSEYIKLWANDWLSLVLYPQHWPSWLTTQADGSLFPACRLQDNCWVLARNDVSLIKLVSLAAVSFAGVVGGFAVLAVCTSRVLRRRVGPTTALLWSLALVLHISLLGTSAFEAGLVRYTDTAYTLGVVVLLWFASVLASRIVPPHWLKSRVKWRLSMPAYEVIFSGFYCAGIVLGLGIYWTFLAGGVLSSLVILFYRGLSLIAVAFIVQIAILTLLLWGIRQSRPGVTFSFIHILPIAVVSASLNAAFFVLVPVNIDRSMSVFLLAWMDEHRNKPLTRDDLARALFQVYFDKFGAIDRRLSEQLVSGDIVPSGDGYALTDQGARFVVMARQIGKLFSTDQRVLHPMEALRPEYDDPTIPKEFDRVEPAPRPSRTPNTEADGIETIRP